MPLALLKDLGFTILLLAVIPFLILYFVGLPNGLIATLIYLQLIIIWAQAEISLRQQELIELQSLPIITLHYHSSPDIFTIFHHKIGIPGFIVRNVGNGPAFNIKLSRLLSKDYTPINPNIWEPLVRREAAFINVLNPGEEKEFFFIDPGELLELVEKRNARVIEISYMDRYGRWHLSYYIINFNGIDFEVIPVIDEKHRGFLLPMLGRIQLLLSIYRLLRGASKEGKRVNGGGAR